MPSVVAPAMEIGLQYTHSAFRAVSQMLCIGYGLAEPVRASEIWVVVWSMTIGASLYGLLVANMGHLLANVDHGSRRFANSFESLNTMMRARSLPGELRERNVLVRPGHDDVVVTRVFLKTEEDVR